MKKDNYFLDLDFTDRLVEMPVERREFLKVFGGGILIFMAVGNISLNAQEGSGNPWRPRLPEDFNAFLRIAEDGRVACYTGKIEMGQGIITSLAQMLSDELDAPLESIDMVMGDTDLCPWDMGTFGSMSTRFFGPALRSAAAEGRMVLLELAASHLNLPIEKLVAEKGLIYERSNGEKSVTYGQLAKGKKIARKASGEAPVKSLDQLKLIGKPLTRRDALEKVTGQAKYAADIQLPGMLYAKILRPPAHGAKRISVDLSAARMMEGIEVIEDGDLIAVLHEYPDMAEKALSKIKVLYDTPDSDLDENTIFEHLLKTAPKGEKVSENGDLKKGRSQAFKKFELTFLDGYKAHAPIEPHSAVVHVEKDRATVWPSSQTPFRVKDEVAEVLKIKSENVHIISPFLGGGFGGKSSNKQVVEAARLSQLSAKPIQVAWTREEEFFYDSFRPAAVVKIDSGMDNKGQIIYWDYHVYFAGERGAQHFYNIPHSSTMAYNSGWGSEKSSHPFATGAWRAPANNTNTFARESQIDIMASAIGMDPLEFRLQNLTDEKMKGCLRAAAKKFGWNSAAAPSGHGYGIACGTDAGTSVASMAEVTVDPKSGDVKVKRVVCAQNMGQVINPQGAIIQMEGCITMGLGYALAEDITFKGGRILDVNFDTYVIPRFSWLPKIETVIIEAENDPPQGGGEPAIVTMGAVIANAIYDAVGARVLQLPLTAERIRNTINKKI